MFRRTILSLATAALVSTVGACKSKSEEIGCIDTTFRLLGKNDAVCVQAFDDPRVTGVACHVSLAKTGGIGGSIGWAEDPSRFSVACRQIGPIDEKSITGLPVKEQVFTERASILFKATHVTRLWDPRRRTLIYLVTSDRLVDGSPFNAISTVPVQPWGAR